MPEQDQWRFCGKCNAMFFDGSAAKGVCPAGGGHQAIGFMFVLPHDVPPSATAQDQWRFCGKCNAMFFDGSEAKGVCPAGGGHQAAGFMFVLPHDVPPSATGQDQWRFCGKCNAMFFDGSAAKGVCPAGGGHQAAGFMFVLPHRGDPQGALTLRFKGINCFGVTDGPGSDEIYLFTIVTTIQGGRAVSRTEKHPVAINVYEEVDEGSSFGGPIAPCYSGPPQDLSLSVILMEHDEGDPNAFRDKVDAAVNAAATVLAVAAGVPLPPIATELVGAAVNELLGTGDDVIAQASRTFSAADLAREAQNPHSRERDVDFTFFTDHRGLGATYKAYFDVTRS